MADKKPPEEKPQRGHKHPDRYQADLEPSRMAGQNIGARRPEEEPRTRRASDIKEMSRLLRDFTEDELEEIPVLEAGERLEQGATYLDLADPRREPFTAVGGMNATPEHLYVPRTLVPYPYWNRLLGLEDPQRPQ